MSVTGEKIERRRSARYGESGYARNEADFYPTPDWVTDALLDNYALRGIVWEPAAGDGRMAARIRLRHKVGTSDLRASPGLDACTNFIEVEGPQPFASIVTNPPYTLAESFVRKALNMTHAHGGIVAMLLRHDWDTAAGRRDLSELLTLKIVLTRRIRWIEGSTGSPRENHAWYIWDHRALGKRRAIYPKLTTA